MNAPTRKGLLALLLIFVVIFSVGGFAWFAATRSLTGSESQTFICRRCAAQVTERISHVLEIRGKPSTNQHATDTFRILGEGQGCSHMWSMMNQGSERLRLRPFPVGEDHVTIVLDFTGITDRAEFHGALSNLARVDLSQARRAWSSVVEGAHRWADPRIVALKQADSATRIEEILHSLGAKGP